MELGDLFSVSEKKAQDLLRRMEVLDLKLSAIKETFSCGGGKGGQKVNKTSSKVTLSHQESGFRVTCQKDRKRSLNRFLALRMLVEKLEAANNPKESAAFKKAEKIRKQKKRRKRRTELSKE